MPAPLTIFPRYQDGDYSTPVRISRTPREYPFSSLGDVTSAIYSAVYIVDLARYVPTAKGAVDPENASFYLIDETKPSLLSSGDQGQLARFIRTYANIPADQVSYGTRNITKPAVTSVGTSFSGADDLASGDVVVLADCAIFNQHVWFPDNKFYGPFKAAANSLTPASGGTFRLNYKASTTGVLNWSDSNATINAALNGLASVIADGLTFSANNVLSNALAALLELTLTAGATTTLVTMTSSLTPAAASIVHSRFNTASVMDLRIARRLAITAHGFTAGQDIMLATGGFTAAARVNPAWWSIVDANTLAIEQLMGQNMFNAGQFLRSYTPGTKRVRKRSTEKFYLPGVTPGIATPDDIPVPATLLNDYDFLASVIANTTGYVTYDASELTRWKDSSIYTQTLEDINMSDV